MESTWILSPGKWRPSPPRLRLRRQPIKIPSTNNFEGNDGDFDDKYSDANDYEDDNYFGKFVCLSQKIKSLQ